MNEHKELAIRALQRMKGDDFIRASNAFKDMSCEQMNEQHGLSGKTRFQILDEYMKFNSKIDEAIKWVSDK